METPKPNEHFTLPPSTEETAKETLKVLRKIERHLAKLSAATYERYGEAGTGLVVWNSNLE